MPDDNNEKVISDIVLELQKTIEKNKKLYFSLYEPLIKAIKINESISQTAKEAMKTQEKLSNLMKNVLNENPNFYHYKQVKVAYENKHYGVVILLLSTFFESLLSSSLKQYFKDIKDSESTEGSLKFIERMSFRYLLKFSRITGLLNEEEFQIINQLKKARDKFAHDFNTFSLTSTSEVIEGTRLEDSIKLYEKLLKIPTSESMIN